MHKFYTIIALSTIFCTPIIAGCDEISPPATVTKSEYESIRDGMSYTEVSRIIDNNGEEISSSKVEGIPGIMPTTSIKMYMWKNSDGSNMNAIFENNRLVNKAQFGLK